MPDSALKNEWKGVNGDGLYGFLSTFAHPRRRLVMETIDVEPGGFRVTPFFRENYFLSSSFFLTQGLVRMMEFLYQLVNPVAPHWTGESQVLMDRAHKCLDQLIIRCGDITNEE